MVRRFATVARPPRWTSWKIQKSGRSRFGGLTALTYFYWWTFVSTPPEHDGIIVGINKGYQRIFYIKTGKIARRTR
jgi:hypothetical protein